MYSHILIKPLNTLSPNLPSPKMIAGNSWSPSNLPKHIQKIAKCYGNKFDFFKKAIFMKHISSHKNLKHIIKLGVGVENWIISIPPTWWTPSCCGSLCQNVFFKGRPSARFKSITIFSNTRVFRFLILDPCTWNFLEVELLNLHSR